MGAFLPTPSIIGGGASGDAAGGVGAGVGAGVGTGVGAGVTDADTTPDVVGVVGVVDPSFVPLPPLRP